MKDNLLAFVVLFGLLFLLLGLGCKQPNKTNTNIDRVGVARAEKDSLLQALLLEKKINGKFEIYVRAFKAEKELEIWVKPLYEPEDSLFRLLKSYVICSASGSLGHKNKEGDGQVPEGLYYIRNFNPTSRFYLSLGLNYPSERDQIRGQKLGLSASLGSDIYIHGDCVSVGCLALTDDYIKEVYLLAFWAQNMGQKQVPVHIFPAKTIVDKEKSAAIRVEFPTEVEAWDNLANILTFFEQNKRLPIVQLDENGFWLIK
jgi:murein L,D-transpeptidase YafK